MQTMTGGARFIDLTYDGNFTTNWISIDGLGQITDSLYGPNDFEMPDILDTSGKFIAQKRMFTNKLSRI